MRVVRLKKKLKVEVEREMCKQAIKKKVIKESSKSIKQQEPKKRT